MEWWQALIFIFGLLVVFMVMGMPVGVAFLFVNSIGILIWLGGIQCHRACSSWQMKLAGQDKESSFAMASTAPLLGGTIIFPDLYVACCEAAAIIPAVFIIMSPFGFITFKVVLPGYPAQSSVANRQTPAFLFPHLFINQ